MGPRYKTIDELREQFNREWEEREQYYQSTGWKIDLFLLSLFSIGLISLLFIWCEGWSRFTVGM